MIVDVDNGYLRLRGTQLAVDAEYLSAAGINATESVVRIRVDRTRRLHDSVYSLDTAEVDGNRHRILSVNQPDESHYDFLMLRIG